MLCEKKLNIFRNNIFNL